MISELLGIQFNIEKARLDRKVQNLASYINENSLMASHKEMYRKKAKGIDGVAKDDYSIELEANIKHLVKRMKNGSYKPEPIRRVYIPKDGSNKMRPLGISCYEDKIVEKVIAEILTMVYEPKFYNTSYGFRPNRNCHQAVREIIEDVQYHKVNYIVEADIKGFFDNVDHEWMIKFLEHDIADKKFIEIIKKFLKAGIMEDGKFLDSEKGTPQGNGASPILANIYLHYVLDLWFEVKVKRQVKGEAYLIRYCDDFVCCFQNKWEAEEFYQNLIGRFAKFGLELSMEKTKILEFGRFTRQNRAKRGMNLLLNYYRPDNGTIRINHTEVRDIKNLNQLITVMRQDAVFFEDTLRNNITMYQDISDDLLTITLHKVGLKNYAAEDKLDMIINEGGTNLSGGERRRVTLARALLRPTPILILDEPLANLDEKNSKAIESLLLSIKDRTLIIISHQFSQENLDRLDKVIEFKS